MKKLKIKDFREGLGEDERKRFDNLTWRSYAALCELEKEISDSESIAKYYFARAQIYSSTVEFGREESLMDRFRFLKKAKSSFEEGSPYSAQVFSKKIEWENRNL